MPRRARAGSAVSITGDTWSSARTRRRLPGANMRARLRVRSWVTMGAASTMTASNAEEFDLFGSACGFRRYVVIGRARPRSRAWFAGAACVFRGKAPTGWSRPSCRRNAADDDGFGVSVGLSGRPWSSGPLSLTGQERPMPGSYVYRRQGTRWIKQAS